MLKRTTLCVGAACMAMFTSASAQAADPIKVGVVTPLSGTYAPIGKQVRWGAELAVKEINAAGGVNGRPFELLFEDEEANPPVAVRKAEKSNLGRPICFTARTRPPTETTMRTVPGPARPAIRPNETS